MMADGKVAIDRLRSPDGSLDREAIRQILPYGDDFLFVDHVTKLRERELEASFSIPKTTPYLEAHFRGLPIMPGALLVESFAQAGALMVRYNLAPAEDPKAPQEFDILGHHVESARILSPALPGETLQFHAELKTFSRRAARVVGEVCVGKRKVGRIRMVLAIMDREDLRREIERLSQP
jgi:3-hydroxyacyl-[acyl-carrier-protein] dehydratase